MENVYNENNVTNDDNVFAFGTNTFGVLGFGNNDYVNELTLIKELSHKRMIDFKNSENHPILLYVIEFLLCLSFNSNSNKTI